MTKIRIAILVSAFIAVMPALSTAAESDTCKGCHNGSVAPTADSLKAKFKTADALVAAAKSSQNPMMKSVQGDEAKLKAAAAEIVK